MREKIRENASTTSHRIQIIRTNEYYGKFVIGMTNMVNIRETNNQLPWHTDKCDKNNQIINKYITNTHAQHLKIFCIPKRSKIMSKHYLTCALWDLHAMNKINGRRGR